MKYAIIDTGCIVALLDKSEKHHTQCVNAITNFQGQLITCEAVITECCYLLRNLHGAQKAVLTNIRNGIFTLPFHCAEYTNIIISLLNKYKNVPMDFADACLVVMAEHFKTNSIFTLDSDFSLYHFGKNKEFKNLIFASPGL